MGKLIFNGIVNHDLHLVQGVVLTIAFTFVLVNIIVDILYVLINPKQGPGAVAHTCKPSTLGG